MKKIMTTALKAVTVLALAALVSCGSTKVEPAAQGPKSNSENNVVVAPVTKMEILDWSNRGLGSPAQPDWLQSLVIFKNGDAYKKMAGIDENRVLKTSSFTGKSEVQALNLALGEFAWSLAAELGTSLEGYLTVGTGTRNQHEMNALRNYAARVHADIVGAREETRFWQKLRTTDPETGKQEIVYNYHVVYSMDAQTWELIVKKYMTDLIGELVENNVDQTFIAEVGACYSRLVADADKKDKLQAEKELAAARAAQAQADAEAAKANQAAAEAQYASKKLDAETEAKVDAAKKSRELMYQSFLK